MCIHSKDMKEHERNWEHGQFFKKEMASDGMVRDIVCLEVDTELTAYRAGED